MAGLAAWLRGTSRLETVFVMLNLVVCAGLCLVFTHEFGGKKTFSSRGLTNFFHADAAEGRGCGIFSLSGMFDGIEWSLCGAQKA